MYKSSAFSGLNSNVTVVSRINQAHSAFFCDIFRTVNERVPKFFLFSFIVIKHISAKKSKPNYCLKKPFKVKPVKMTSKRLFSPYFDSQAVDLGV